MANLGLDNNVNTLPSLMDSVYKPREELAKSIFKFAFTNNSQLRRSDGFVAITVADSSGVTALIKLLKIEMSQTYENDQNSRIFDAEIIRQTPALWKIRTLDMQGKYRNQIVAPIIVRSFFSSCWNYIIHHIARDSSPGVAVNSVPSALYLFNSLSPGPAVVSYAKSALWDSLSAVNSTFLNFKVALAIGVMCTEKVTVNVLMSEGSTAVNLASGDLVFIDLSNEFVSEEYPIISASPPSDDPNWFAFVTVHFVWLVGGLDASRIITAFSESLDSPVRKIVGNAAYALRTVATASFDCIEEIPDKELTFANLVASASVDGPVGTLYNRNYFRQLNDQNASVWYLKPVSTTDAGLVRYEVESNGKRCIRTFSGEYAERMSIFYSLYIKSVAALCHYTVSPVARSIVTERQFYNTTTDSSPLFTRITPRTGKLPLRKSVLPTPLSTSGIPDILPFISAAGTGVAKVGSAAVSLGATYAPVAAEVGVKLVRTVLGLVSGMYSIAADYDFKDMLTRTYNDATREALREAEDEVEANLKRGSENISGSGESGNGGGSSSTSGIKRTKLTEEIDELNREITELEKKKRAAGDALALARQQIAEVGAKRAMEQAKYADAARLLEEATKSFATLPSTPQQTSMDIEGFSPAIVTVTVNPQTPPPQQFAPENLAISSPIPPSQPEVLRQQEEEEKEKEKQLQEQKQQEQQQLQQQEKQQEQQQQQNPLPEAQPIPPIPAQVEVQKATATQEQINDFLLEYQLDSIKVPEIDDFKIIGLGVMLSDEDREFFETNVKRIFDMINPQK